MIDCSYFQILIGCRGVWVGFQVAGWEALSRQWYSQAGWQAGRVGVCTVVAETCAVTAGTTYDLHLVLLLPLSAIIHKFSPSGLLYHDSSHQFTSDLGKKSPQVNQLDLTPISDLLFKSLEASIPL
ncbi:hypothetical protein DSO57_1014422 [Entomophthora muscae]|uniref:Uncharacterized protein n=1 Tax=Entomophthora muscae TaxID=34485 RepID=A0ACC2UQT1_9FUNG|nr:hypothetical protein DSO57_1014422 [Entomophthora muscae]